MSAPRTTALLLHGFGGAGRSWALVRALLPVESIAPDLPGFGWAPPLPALSIDAYAAFVVEKLAALEGLVVLVGSSMGGKIAMAAASQRPDLLGALVLCAPSPPTPEPIEADQRRSQRAAWGDREAGERSVRESLGKPAAPAVFDALVADWLAVDEQTWRWWWDSGSRETIDVHGVMAPTVILGGEADPRLGAQAQSSLTLPHLPGARLRPIEGAGHLLAIDDPRSVADAIALIARDL